ncbi:MAG: hypothetical protein U5L04_01560 [Trueperaceae bacterium]|nr:hypothetical protein [Trueperaceae bacterium]
MTRTQRTQLNRTIRWKDGLAVWVLAQLRPLTGRFSETASEMRTLIRYTDADGGGCILVISRHADERPARCEVGEGGCEPDAVNAMLNAVAMADRGVYV